MTSMLSEELKIDTGLIPTAALNGAATGPYYSLADYGKALFIAEIGAMAATVTCALQAVQAKDGDGTDWKDITDLTATITANAGVDVATLTLAAVQVGDVVTVNGITFKAATAADLKDNVFDQSGDNDADAASLAAAINHANGVPGVTAEASGAVVTLTPTEPGVATITIADPSGTITPATVRAIGYLEVDASMLDAEDGFTHVALKVTTSAAAPTAAVLVRGRGRYSPVQAVAASDTKV